MRAFESIGDMVAGIMETFRSSAKQKLDPVPRWLGGRIAIGCSARDVYEFWRAPKNLPNVLRTVRSLTLHEGGVTEWRLRGYLGQALAYRCEPVVEEIGSRIEWRSAKDAPVHGSLNVHFTAQGDEACELVVEWTMALRPEHESSVPPTLDGIFDEFTQRMLDDDLDRLRIFLELEVARKTSEAAAALAAEELSSADAYETTEEHEPAIEH